MQSAAAEILDIVDQVLAIVQHLPQDLTWQSRYSNGRELVDDLTDHAGRIRRGDSSRLPDLRFLFMPTGPLCEIAASSGWLDTYAVLGNRFDESHERLRQP
ncbi:hypothetical protein AB0H00_23590 [Nocardia sp. NPDC023852]|uniref:hypothetical protein n=1 Tax=Nocardia sp. NPDC023852 TaxID=3154697 RepID=UPI0033C0B7AF